MEEAVPKGRMRRVWERCVEVAEHAFDDVVTVLGSYRKTILKERDLFLGVALLCMGLFSFESGRYCDGNTAEYLSCTRPATYYYFDYLDVALVIIGVSLILIWVVTPTKPARKSVHESRVV